jgi:hypothetical protein
MKDSDATFSSGTGFQEDVVKFKRDPPCVKKDLI